MVERIDKEQGILLSRIEIERAVEELSAAKALHENAIYFKSIASAYYAIYHASKALLLLKGIDPKTHEGVERMFGLYFIKTNEFDVSVGKALGRLMKMRQEADYHPEIPFTGDESTEAIQMAAAFIEKARELM